MSQNIVFQHRSDELVTWTHRESKGGMLDFCTPHVHREMELIFYYGGRTTAYSDSFRYELQAGDVFLTFPNQIHSYETREKESFRLFLVKPEIIPELLDVFDMAVPQSAVIHGAANEPRLQMLAEALVEAFEYPDGHPYRSKLLRGYLLALFSELLGRMQLDVTRLADSHTLRSIVAFCSRNYDRELSLAVLEEELHLNRYYISHLFSGRLGMRFNDYINSLRISEACRRLLYSDESVTEISTRVGFCTLRTFNRAFAKQMGMTPSEYRKSGTREKRKPE